jgi:hypothetical protein
VILRLTFYADHAMRYRLTAMIIAAVMKSAPHILQKLLSRLTAVATITQPLRTSSRMNGQMVSSSKARGY